MCTYCMFALTLVQAAAGAMWSGINVSEDARVHFCVAAF